MAKRSVTDAEIGLIKAMLARGMKNKDIQFFFNRPDRPVNSGRITGIRKGTYGPSVPTASSDEFDRFLNRYQRVPIGMAVPTPANPTIQENVRRLFRKNSDGSWSLVGGESEEHECKEDFDFLKFKSVVRAVAALANNKGGLIVFGISDSGYKVVGIGPSFAATDVVKIVEKVKAHLTPTPSITAKDILEFDGLSVGFLAVEKHPDRPVIVYRDGDGLNEGDILFRYAGQSSRIKFGDLRAMLDDRDRRAQQALAAVTGKVAQVGTSNAMILDTEKNVLDADGKSIMIDEKLAESLNFIKEGQFDEKSGALTLKLVGEVSTMTGGGPEHVSREAIFQEDILNDFLNQAKVERPLEYVRAAPGQSRWWLPTFYYARQAGKTNSEVTGMLSELKTSQKKRQESLIERFRGKRSAYSSAITMVAKTIAENIAKGIVEIPTNVAEVTPFAYGLTGVTNTKATLEDLLTALQHAKELADESAEDGAIGVIYKAACRVDELFFADDDASQA